ncbi:hypothetical protein H2200_007663 [Cladophialophora chaetospira]|uniref:Cytochrome P450 n=1 Tax=Cladophialophora chaetospira TaxID=386627 RepID=A0AA39CGT8_9EURO|nr:hypothetical protein H2200_007663 [Cladophialophora chaetospira]
MFAFTILTLPFLVLPLWYLISLFSNYRLARTSKLPILISPVNPFNPFWILLRPYTNPVLSYLPFGLGRSTDYNYLGFAWKDKNRLHKRYGGAYIIVTPGQNQLIVGDATACNDIFKNHRIWPKNDAFNVPLNTFGPNVGTSEGDAWQRQRKITAVAFNERNNSLVWQEAVKQSRQMLATWVLKPESVGVTTTMDDFFLFALHVLTGAGFGRSYDYDSPLKKPDPGHSMSYREALRGVLGNIFITYAIAKAGSLSFLLPASGKRVQRAIAEFKLYMRELVDQERASYSQGKGTNAANLMSTLVRASESEARIANEKLRNSLTDEEFVGNLYIFNLAGHDTTAGTLTYAIGLLACFPEWQDWIKEELREVFGDGDVQENEYEAAFPRLRRCMAIMYETLRLYAPLNGVPRCTGTEPKNLKLGSETYTIPKDTLVFVNNAAVQCDQQHWGDDSLLWRPGRWLKQDAEDKAAEVPVQPKENVYIPWISGPRVCPGKKFSQVEHTAAIACLFHKHRVAPVLEAGESVLQARMRLLCALQDSDMALAMRMNHPERLTLRWGKDV